ncbi:Ferric reduction oxidase 5 [Morella rubra]|uniref:Ferric reduction oxidase 5 n=1 Tax=Morella rubra TaxID=262757 RepID=A0A6A1WBF1_9ROSI|nr:Ferric reduction oxidase 5 [Morella rubra]
MAPSGPLAPPLHHPTSLLHRRVPTPSDPASSIAPRQAPIIEAEIMPGIETPVIEAETLVPKKKAPSEKPPEKQYSLQGKQIQNLEVPTPTISPGSRFCVADGELESLPQQSLVQATEVHFGARPDLKKILSECKGSDVGVLVCGPRELRHDVAKICSSGLAENLHFESLSFNW